MTEPAPSPSSWRPWTPRFLGAGFRRTRGAVLEEFEVDVVAARHAPLRSHPRVAVLRTAILVADADGLGSDAEMDLLDHAVSRVCLALRAELRGVPVADVVSGGERRVLVYLPGDVEAAQVDAVARRVSAAGEEAERRFMVAVDDDPTWEAFFAELDDAEFAAELGDDLSVLDDLDGPTLALTFHGLFPTPGAAAEAAAILADLGSFAVGAPPDGDDATDDGVPMDFTTEIPADGDEMCVAMFLARLAVGAVGGELDGWGSSGVFRGDDGP